MPVELVRGKAGARMELSDGVSIDILRTDQDGRVTVTSGGQRLWIETER